jgi:hypothetical protein
VMILFALHSLSVVSVLLRTSSTGFNTKGQLFVQGFFWASYCFALLKSGSDIMKNRCGESIDGFWLLSL